MKYPLLSLAQVHPDIPQNTGNIARLCVGLDAELHLVQPMAFVIDDKRVKRAGLDYWPNLKLTIHESLDNFLQTRVTERLFFLTTKATQCYTDVTYRPGDTLVLGSESRGLPADLLARFPEQLIGIPMPGAVRSLNVSNAAAIVAYEAYRQITLGEADGPKKLARS